MSIAIDVVIPVHNGAAFIGRAIDGVRAQEGDWQLRVFAIDDGSTDDSPRLLESLARKWPQLTVLSHIAPRGAAAARNRGVAAGAADFIAFLDQDDEWVPHKLLLQIPLFVADPTLMYAVGQQRFVLAEGLDRPAWCRREWLDGPQAGFLPSALVIRRAAWKLVGPLDETLLIGADDVEWFARARDRGAKAAAVPEVVVHRHIHARNASSDTEASNRAILQAVRRQLLTKGPSNRDRR
jgi:glycosyltransferase involved in cell wall biosynthesis